MAYEGIHAHEIVRVAEHGAQGELPRGLGRHNDGRLRSSKSRRLPRPKNIRLRSVGEAMLVLKKNASLGNLRTRVNLHACSVQKRDTQMVCGS